MRDGVAFLYPADGEGAGDEVDLVPAKVDQFAGPEAVTVGHQDHGRVAMAPAVALGGFLKASDLSVRQVLSSPDLSVGRTARRRNCSFFGGWSNQLEVGFCHSNQAPAKRSANRCPPERPFLFAQFPDS